MDVDGIWVHVTANQFASQCLHAVQPNYARGYQIQSLVS